MHDTRRTRWLLGILLVAALGLITLSYTDGGSPVLRGARSAAGTIFGGLERGAGTVTGGSGGRSGALARQVVALRAQLSEARLGHADLARLRNLLSLAGRGGYRVETANVIASGQGYQQTVTLDVGSRQGVAPRETVLNGQGLVGEVTAVTAQTATVQLAAATDTVIGVMAAPSGDTGWVSGRGPGDLLRLQMLSTTAVLHPGEQLVTSASVNDRPYVPGVPVGTVSQVTSAAAGQAPVALIRPYARFAALSVVGVVITPPHRSPRFAVLPRSPRARPEPTVTVTVTPRPAALRPAPTPTAGG